MYVHIDAIAFRAYVAHLLLMSAIAEEFFLLFFALVFIFIILNAIKRKFKFF